MNFNEGKIISRFSLKMNGKNKDTFKRLEYLDVIEYLQILWTYFEHKRENEKCYVDDLILFNLEWLCLIWPDFFPNLLCVYE